MSPVATTVLTAFLVALLGYLLGSVNTAEILSHSRGIEIRNYGSKNAGGTNVGRVIGKKEGLTVMGIDILKTYLYGLTVKLLVHYLLLPYLVPFDDMEEALMALGALFLALGHAYPCFFRFKGGKCVACFTGYVLLSSPILAASGALVFFLVLKKGRRLSLASLTGMPTSALLSFVPMALDLTITPSSGQFDGGFYVGPGLVFHLSWITTLALFLLFLFSLYRHRSNVKRLLNGTEPVTKFKKNDGKTDKTAK